MPHGLTPSGREILAPYRHGLNKTTTTSDERGRLDLILHQSRLGKIAANHGIPRPLIAEHAGKYRTYLGSGLADTAWRMPSQTRRSRMRRTQTGKRIELTARDIEIFRLLERYRYLRSTFIHAFVGGASETRFKERLGHLYHEGGYLDRPQQQWLQAKSRYMPVVHTNTDAARQVLRRYGLLDAENGLRAIQAGANCQFAHSLMICEILASIDLGAKSETSLRFISWQEILSKAPKDTRECQDPFRIPVSASGEYENGFVVPDGLFGLEYTVGAKKSYRFFALEADRATMPVTRSRPGQTSYLKKMLAYREIIVRQIYKSHLGLPNLLVLTVTTLERHKNEMLSAFSSVAGNNAALLFKTCDVLGRLDVAATPMAGLLMEPWQRAGFEPLHIANAS